VSGGGTDSGALRALRWLGVWSWFVFFVGLLPALVSLGLNVLLVRQGWQDEIAPWRLLLGFALLAYGAYGIRERLPLWGLVADEPGYRRRQIRRHASQIVRLARRALRRPWYRRRLSSAAAGEVDAAVQALRAALRDRGAADELHGPLERLEALFDKHLTFMKFSVYVEYAGQIGLAVLAAFVLRESVVEAFKIPSGSMLPTLEVGDHIFVNKLSYGVRFPFSDWIPLRYDSPHRGDVIVFSDPRGGGDDFIKRVVAVSGDRLRVDKRGVLWINGREVGRCPLGTIRAPVRDDPAGPRETFDVFVERLGGVRYAIRQIHDPDTPQPGTGGSRRPPRDLGGGLLLVYGNDRPGRPFPQSRPGEDEYVVPAGRVFVMGDNRDNSNDSRFWGTVPLEHIKGKAVFIWWSNAYRSVDLGRVGIGIHGRIDPEGLDPGRLRGCLDELGRPDPGAP
jgi:signal peptidase I